MALTGIDVKIEHGAGSGSTETRPRGSTGVSSEHPRLPGRNQVVEQPKPNRKSFSAKLKGVVANGQNRVPSEKDGFEGEMLISSRKNAMLTPCFVQKSQKTINSPVVEHPSARLRVPSAVGHAATGPMTS